jgi:hypothetical protein
MKNKDAMAASNISTAGANTRLVVSKKPAKKTDEELAFEEYQRQFELAMENH